MSDETQDPPQAPLERLARWIEDARAQEQPHPAAAAFVTADAAGRPSARTVTLKRIEPDALIFTTALWTRKAWELRENPHVALLFHWPALGRQVHVAGTVELGSRALAAELFAERPRDHRYQAVVSRQGEVIEDLAPIRDRLRHLQRVEELPPACPDDWGAVRVLPHAVEFWEEAADRLHDRLLYEPRPEGGWGRVRLAP